MKKDIKELTIDEIIQELQHYTNGDLMELSIYQLLDIWCRLTEEYYDDKQYSGLLEEE